MRQLCLLLFVVACQKDPAATADLRAACKPDINNDRLECTIENAGNKATRACITARVQPPKKQPLVAKRLCTKPLAPGEKSQVLTPRFDRVESLQSTCAVDGTFVCAIDIVETPQQMTDNIPD